MLHALLMAGGGGTRFWPRSRQRCPKQFLKIAGERSLLQQAFDRIEALVTAERTWAITAAAQRALVSEQLPELPPDNVVGEPVGRDTAACIGLGAALIARDDPDAVMVCTPADHIIEPQQEFRRAVLAGAALAEEHPTALITLGVPPSFPATGYGYIQRGAELSGRQGIAAFHIQAFKEKPDADSAERYLAGGQFFWNSGIFIWKAMTLLTELQRRQPDVHAALSRIAAAWPTSQRDQVFADEYEPLKRLSIDYAVMEGCRQGIVMPAPFHWDDVGSWQAVERMNPQDAHGNTVLATHLSLDGNNNLVVGEPGRLIATIGVHDLVIVQDGDATLVADKRDEAAVKKLVELLKENGLERYL